MTRRARRTVLATAMLFGVLAPNAVAANETYHVSKTGSGTTCAQGAPCLLSQALANTKDGSAADSDTISLPVADFTGGAGDALNVNDAGQANLHIVGQGRAQTLLRPVVSGIPFRIAAPNVTVSAVTLDGGSSSTGPATVDVSSGSSLTLDDAKVAGRDFGSATVALSGSGSADLTVRDSEVSLSTLADPSPRTIALTGSGGQHGTLTVTGSTVTLDGPANGTFGSAISTAGDYDTTITGTAVRVSSAIPNLTNRPYAVTLGAAFTARTATITDSVFAGGAGIQVGVSPIDTGSFATTIRRVSVDAGDVGVADDPNNQGFPRALNLLPGAAGSIDVRDAAIAEIINLYDVTPTCSDISQAKTSGNFGMAACTGLTDTGGNLGALWPADTAATVFAAGVSARTALTTAFTPGAGSILIDTGGAANGVGVAGVPALDVAGHPRLIDGNDDCIARLDRGAIELQGHVLDPCPSVPTTTVPDTGNPGTDPGTGPGTTPAATPVLGSLALKPGSPVRKKALKAAFTFTLNTGATVAVRLDQLVKGKRVGKRCKTSGKLPRKARACTAVTKRGTVSVAAAAGATTVVLGRLSKRTPAAGRYRLTLVATGTGGVSAPRALTFTIKR